MRSLGPADPVQVGPYRLEAVLGAGGMGRVYLGRTPAGSEVAVKVVHREYAGDRAFRKRFELEVAAARRVQGLYTVPVVDADLQADEPWLATAYVPGPSLQDAVVDDGPLGAEAALGLVARVAEALQSVHAAGVIHRDLKPSNILLTAEGPKVIDFGIARAADVTSVTGTGTRAGTPAYMAPEYIRGHELTEAVDVFALGLIAHFAATGRLAFGGGSDHGVTYRILEQDPDLSGAPEPVRRVATRCLHKQPQQRPTPAQVIELCRPAPTAPRVDEEQVDGGEADGGQVGGALAAEPQPDAVPTLVQAPAGSRTLTEEPPTVPATAQQDATDDPPAASGRDAGAEPSASPGPGRPSSRSTALIGGAAVAVLGVVAGLVSFAWGFSDSAPEFGPTATLKSPDVSVNDLAFSPDSDMLAVGTLKGNVRLWDVAERKRRATLTHRDESGVGPNEVHSLDFSPDGRTLATGTEDGAAYLWNVAGRKKAATLHGGDGPVKSVDFGPDGTKLATGSLKGKAYLKYTGGRSKGRVSAGFDHGTAVGPAAVSPDGKVLVTATLQGHTPQVAKLWDTAGGKARHTLPHKGGLSSAAFSPDSEKLAVGGPDGKVSLWDVSDHRLEETLSNVNLAPVTDVAFSPDGRTLAAASRDRVCLWDVDSREPRAYLTGLAKGNGLRVAFSPDGRRIAVGGGRGTVQLWKNPA